MKFSQALQLMEEGKVMFNKRDNLTYRIKDGGLEYFSWNNSWKTNRAPLEELMHSEWKEKVQFIVRMDTLASNGAIAKSQVIDTFDSKEAAKKAIKKHLANEVDMYDTVLHFFRRYSIVT